MHQLTKKKPFLLEAEQSLKNKKYLPKILSDLQFFLTPLLAIKSRPYPQKLKLSIWILSQINIKLVQRVVVLEWFLGGFSGFGGR